MSWEKISFKVRSESTNAWPRYINRWRPGAGCDTTAAVIFALNSPTVVAVDMDEKVSLLTSDEGDRITRLISLLPMTEHLNIGSVMTRYVSKTASGKTIRVTPFYVEQSIACMSNLAYPCESPVPQKSRFAEVKSAFRASLSSTLEQ